jgi:hypothetical protein
MTSWHNHLPALDRAIVTIESLLDEVLTPDVSPTKDEVMSWLTALRSSWLHGYDSGQLVDKIVQIAQGDSTAPMLIRSALETVRTWETEIRETEQDKA